MKDFVFNTVDQVDENFYIDYPVIFNTYLQAFSSLLIWDSCYWTSASWPPERTTGYRYSYWYIDDSFKF